jgi:alpha-beta hydrolase superfamily lysophospholipase
MTFKLRHLFHHALRIVLYGVVGATLALVIVYVIMLNERPDLSVWHEADLGEEFTVHSDVSTFAEYLALEDRLFKQLDDLVYAKTVLNNENQINRYSRGSMSDPQQWPQNWNRTFEMPVDSPKATVLLLHGMSDSPYSLRHFAESLHGAGAYVVGLRIPGHGTAPSGLLRVRWQDMAAAVKISMRYVEEKAGSQPVYIVGYSNGAALAVNYALDAVADSSLPQLDGLVLLSPEIGVSSVAAFAVWQARLGVLLGLNKLAWNGLLPEYDPYKYGSFAVNAADVAHRLTVQIQKQLTVLGKKNQLDRVPPTLAFSSVVDATVLAPDLIANLFDRLPEGGHELILFDVNRVAQMAPIIRWQSDELDRVLGPNPDWKFTLGLVTNSSPGTLDVLLSRKKPGEDNSVETDLGLSWPRNVYSLSHVALPFPAEDPLYGSDDNVGNAGIIQIGNVALRGEKGALRIPAAEMLRQRWNPFFPFVMETTLNFLSLEDTASQNLYPIEEVTP